MKHKDALKVLVIAQYFPPDMGGGSRRVANALEGLRRLGHHIEVVSAFPHYPHGKIPRRYRGRAFAVENFDGMRVIRVWIPSIAHVGFLRRTIMYVVFAISALLGVPFAGQTDVIWAANSNVFSSFPALIYSLVKRAPIVRNVDDLWPDAAMEEGYFGEGVFARIGRWLAKAAYKLCRALTPISRAYQKEIVHQYCISTDKIHVIEVGVDTDAFHPATAPTPMSKRRSTSSITVMYSGILGTGYNFDLILQAANQLSSYEDVHFAIRGIGEREQEIRTKIAKEGLRNVTLSTDFIILKELVKLINSADILILPMMPMEAHEAGIPTKLFEYMACGRPVICCSEGEAADLVRRANCGIVASPRSPEEVVNAILALSKDRRLMEELGQNGRNYVTRHLSIKQIGKKLEHVFLSITKN